MFENTDTSGAVLPVSLFGVDSLSEMIGRVRPEAVSLVHPACILGITKSSIISKKFSVLAWERLRKYSEYNECL